MILIMIRKVHHTMKNGQLWERECPFIHDASVRELSLVNDASSPGTRSGDQCVGMKSSPLRKIPRLPGYSSERAT